MRKQHRVIVGLEGRRPHRVCPARNVEYGATSCVRRQAEQCRVPAHVVRTAIAKARHAARIYHERTRCPRRLAIHGRVEADVIHLHGVRVVRAYEHCILRKKHRVIVGLERRCPHRI